MNYLDILQDREIMSIYNQIDILKQNDPKHYGNIHVLSTIEYANQLSECFDLTRKEKELLLIACVLHNIGYLNRNTLHAQIGAEMARGYLKKHNVNIKDINTICGAISSHMGKGSDNFYDNVSACLILADKMDFGESRIKPYFEPTDWEIRTCKSITYVNVFRKNDLIQLDLGGAGVDWNDFTETSAYNRLYKCFETACKKRGYRFIVKVKTDFD